MSLSRNGGEINEIYKYMVKRSKNRVNNQPAPLATGLQEAVNLSAEGRGNEYISENGYSISSCVIYYLNYWLFFDKSTSNNNSYYHTS